MRWSARPEHLDDGPAIPVLTAEDVIIHKLIAGRSQDIADIEAILASGAAIDDAYVQKWVTFWDLADAWSALHP
jgi:hypothetical protein